MNRSPDSARSTLAVILGASHWPHCPKLAGSPSFKTSSTDFRDYLLDPSGFALPPDQLLDLFDSPDSPAQLGIGIRNFLRDRLGQLKAASSESQPNILVYYVGHGGFASNRDYYLALRSTAADHEGLTSLKMVDLAGILNATARFARRYLVLDCCFSGSAYTDFQSSPLQVACEKIQQVLPPRFGTTILCSSSARDPSIAPKGECYTMFSGALLETLRVGIPEVDGDLSFESLGNHVDLLLREKYPDSFVRPEVHSPLQTEGDIALIPLFPNSAAASSLPISNRSPTPSRHAFSPPDGPLATNSPFLCSRPGEDILLEQVPRSGQAFTIVIKGPRKVGKTTLLYRGIDAAIQSGKSVAVIDFQEIDESSFRTPETFFLDFCHLLSAQLNVHESVARFWNTDLPLIQRCSNYVGNCVLMEIKEPIVLALDEVERLFETSFQSDFFGMLRGWHGRRARPMMPAWKRLSLLLVTSTEPHYFIKNYAQSPFNVATEVLLDFFSTAAVSELNGRYGSPVTPAGLQKLFLYTGGHPFLTHWAIYSVAAGHLPETALFRDPSRPESPFYQHLLNLHLRLRASPEMLQQLRGVLDHGRCSDVLNLVRLQAAGLVRSSGDSVQVTCRLYEEFFRKRLHE